MKLRLAEYKDGKFERFLELGSDFGYFGGFILVSAEYCRSVDPTAEIFALDKKDALNRFDGLFDGRTYGEGRFVLVKNGEDDVKITYNSPVLPFYDPPSFEQKYEIKEVIFNIHENPELYRKKLEKFFAKII